MDLSIAQKEYDRLCAEIASGNDSIEIREMLEIVDFFIKACILYKKQMDYLA